MNGLRCNGNGGFEFIKPPFLYEYKWFSDLLVEYQKILKEGAMIAQNYNRYMNYLQEEQFLDLYRSKGMEVVELSDSEKAAFRDIGQPAVAAEVRKEIGDEFVDWWLNSVEEIRAQEKVDASA